jgi:hypothetical protein
MEIKQQSTGNNDSVEDAVIAIMNIKTTEGKLINFNAQVQAVYDALEQPAQEPQYLYFYNAGGMVSCEKERLVGWDNVLLGKIKLEVEDA